MNGPKWLANSRNTVKLSLLSFFENIYLSIFHLYSASLRKIGQIFPGITNQSPCKASCNLHLFVEKESRQNIDELNMLRLQTLTASHCQFRSNIFFIFNTSRRPYTSSKRQIFRQFVFPFLQISVIPIRFSKQDVAVFLYN